MIDSRLFRNTIGIFATGVTVVAAQVDEEIHAMTANGITSLSLEPPLLIFCLGKKARMADVLSEGVGFSVNILRESQQNLSTYFAGGWKEAAAPPFKFEAWSKSPRLENCAAALACEVSQKIEGGDHWIIIGSVIDLHQGSEPRNPLIFYGGTYRQLVETESAEAIDLIFYDPW